MPIDRRTQLKGILGLAAVSVLPATAGAQHPPIPPEAIGRCIKHLSYSDIGGRPDSVQVMVNRVSMRRAINRHPGIEA